MDDLQDAIQDAQYIGAMCDPTPKPTRRLELPSEADALQHATRLREKNLEALTFEGILSEPLGYYLVSLDSLKTVLNTRGCDWDDGFR